MTSHPQKYDVLIAGAGPAGSATAIRLVLAGLKVLLVERARFPREKLCGEFVSPECMRHFRELGLDSLTTTGYPRIERTIFHTQSGRSAEFLSSWFAGEDSALGISRAEMDASMVDRARIAGAIVMVETAVLDTDSTSSTGVRTRIRNAGGDTNWIDSSIVIDATGRKRALTLDPTRHEKAAKVAFKTHLHGARIPKSVCEIYSYKGGYGGCNAVGGGRFNLCFVVDSRIVKAIGNDPAEVASNVLFRNPAAKRALAEAIFDGEWLAVPIDGFGRRAPVEREGLMFVGDSAAFIDPFTGSGILLALQSAKVAAEAIARGLKARKSVTDIGLDYTARYNALLGKRLRMSSLLRPASNSPLLAEAIVELASRSQRLRAGIARATRSSAAPGA